MLFFKLYLAVYVALYRLSGGRIGGRMLGGDVLLLTTTGRKTGKVRTRPLIYVRDGERYLLAASAGGDTKAPGWYYNATQGTAPVHIQIGPQRLTVSVTEADPDQRPTLYQRFVALSDQYAQFETRAGRQIPVLILTPQH